MAITVVGSGSGSAATGSAIYNMTFDMVAGDVVVVFGYQRATTTALTASCSGAMTPAAVVTATGNATYGSFGVWTFVSDGNYGPGNATWFQVSGSSASNLSIGLTCVVLAGVDTSSTPLTDVGSITDQAAAASFTVTGPTGLASGTMMIGCGASMDNNAPTAAWSAGTTPKSSVTVDISAGADAALGLAWALESSGTAGNFTYTETAVGNDAGRTLIFGVKPAGPETIQGTATATAAASVEAAGSVPAPIEQSEDDDAGLADDVALDLSTAITEPAVGLTDEPVTPEKTTGSPTGNATVTAVATATAAGLLIHRPGIADENEGLVDSVALELSTAVTDYPVNLSDTAPLTRTGTASATAAATTTAVGSVGGGTVNGTATATAAATATSPVVQRTQGATGVAAATTTGLAVTRTQGATAAAAATATSLAVQRTQGATGVAAATATGVAVQTLRAPGTATAAATTSATGSVVVTGSAAATAAAVTTASGSVSLLGISSAAASSTATALATQRAVAAAAGAAVTSAAATLRLPGTATAAAAGVVTAKATQVVRATAAAAATSTAAAAVYVPGTATASAAATSTAAAVQTVRATAAGAATATSSALAIQRAVGSATAAAVASALATQRAAASGVAAATATATASVVVSGTATVAALSSASGAAPTLIRYTANDGSGLTQVAGTWDTPASGYDDNPLTYTTLTSSTTGTYVLDITGYDFASVLGSDDELVEVSVNVSQYVSNAAKFAAPTIQAFNGATPLGSAITLTERESAGNEDEDITALVTIGDLRSPDFKIRYSVEQVSA